MSDLERFSRLEPVPADDTPAEGAAPSAVARRFSAVEPVAVAPAPVHDPFAPPPLEPEVPLQLAHDETPELAELRQRRQQRAQEALAKLVEAPPAPPPVEDASPELRGLARLGRVRLVIVGGVIVLMASTSVLGTWTLLVGPTVIAIVIASYFVGRR